jgi:hypothetical protein
MGLVVLGMVAQGAAAAIFFGLRRRVGTTAH